MKSYPACVALPVHSRANFKNFLRGHPFVTRNSLDLPPPLPVPRHCYR